jgi:hypothetical protein
MGAHKIQRMASALIFWSDTTKTDEFLSHIVQVACDETWVSFVNAETKELSEQWIHTHSPNRPKKFKQKLSACQKADDCCFLGQEGVLMVEFMQQGTTITSEVYCEWHRAIQKKVVEC